MPSLTISIEADRELDALYETHPEDAELIDVFLEQLAADEVKLSTLFHDVPKWEHFSSPPYEVKKFSECFARRRRIYIIKLYDSDDHLSNFRVLVGHDQKLDSCVVLATPNRNFDYDPGSDIFAKLLERYDEAGLDPIG